jgi:hypothetical protein
MLVAISNNIKDLTGRGSEYLVDDQGNVIAIFFDGNLEKYRPVNSEETTLTMCPTIVA